jgi:hypothetical protein
LLRWVQEECYIVSIERSTESAVLALYLGKDPHVCGDLQETVERIDSKVEEKRGEGVPLPKATKVLDFPAWHPIDKNS